MNAGKECLFLGIKVKRELPPHLWSCRRPRTAMVGGQIDQGRRRKSEEIAGKVERRVRDFLLDLEKSEGTIKRSLS